MQEEFLLLSPSTWNLVFLIARYVMAALLLAYLTGVYVKKVDIHTDIKGSVLEWRIDTYKRIHHWVMKLQSVVAAPSQNEEQYSNILSLTKFKIGYQGMEYASFFDTPERLLSMGIELNRMLNKEEGFIDYPLKNKLEDFQCWLDDVILFYGAFYRTECDKRWKCCEQTAKANCLKACKLIGIALQEDVNRYFKELDELLRERLRNIRIEGVYTESLRTRIKKKCSEYCERIMDEEKDDWYSRLVEWLYYHLIYGTYCSSQLLGHQTELMSIFAMTHFEDYLAKHPSVVKDKEQMMRLLKDYSECYSQYPER